MTTPLRDRITSVERIRSWTDQIPFHYEYTAGVAGEKFLRGLHEGRILASQCPSCGRKYIPPKVYCVECYLEVKRFTEVGPEGAIAALAESRVGFEGNPLARPRSFAFVVFKGVTGGLIHLVTGTGLEIGSKVVPKFRAPAKRQGTILDIERFVKA